MPNSSLRPFVRSLELHDELAMDERAAVENLPIREKSFADGEEIVAEGSRPRESCLVLDGFAARTHLLRSGKQQIAAVHIPGDFVDLHSFLLKVMDHSVMAFGDCKVAFVAHDHLLILTEKYPHLTRLLWLSTTIDAAIQRAWIVSMGRRTAEQHFGHLVCELFMRLKSVDLLKDHSFTFPATQAEVGDILGLSTVHVNRMLQNLRATGFVTWQGNIVTVSDFDGLSEMVDFDPTYLNLFKEPR